MSDLRAYDQNRNLLADLKQDTKVATQSNESQATKEHIAGAQGKLAAAISQQQGDSDINAGGRRLARDAEPSGELVDRDRVQESQHAHAEEKIRQETGHEPVNMQRGSEGMDMEKGSVASRVQSAAEQYDLAREGMQTTKQQGE